MILDKNQIREILYVKGSCTFEDMYTHLDLLRQHFVFEMPTRIGLMNMVRQVCQEDQNIFVINIREECKTPRRLWIIQKRHPLI
jgi:hypothetical protein